MERLRTLLHREKSKPSSTEFEVAGFSKLTVNGSPIRVELSDGRPIPSVGFLGPRGTYTEQAKEAILGSDNSNRFTEKPLSIKNKDVIAQVADRKFDLAIVAGENVIEGGVTDVLRELMRRAELEILGEVIVPIDHVLAGKEGTMDIRAVLSHWQALGQCDGYLSSQLPNATRIETSSTAQAALDIMEIDGAAAIISRRAAEMNGLSILAENIGDNPHNSTRFFLIGRGETEPTGNDATTFVFTPKAERAGALDHALRVTTRRNVNLTNIGAHPYPHPEAKMGKYAILVTADGHKRDRNVAKTLAKLERRCESVTVLGSYKKGSIPEGAYVPGTWNGD